MRYVLVLFLMAGVAGAQQPSDLTTANISHIDAFLARASQPGPKVVLAFGDSMSDTYRSVSDYVMQLLGARLGVAGYAFMSWQGNTQISITNGAVDVLPDANWFCDYFRLPPGSSVTYWSQNSPVGNLCDRVGLFCIGQTNGGKMELMVAANTTSNIWSVAGTLNGASASPTGLVLSVSLPLNYYRLRVVSLSGTNLVIGPSMINTHSNGIVAAFTAYGGIGLDMVTNVPLSIRAPFYRALSPDLLIWHMKEDGTGATSNRLVECEEQWWQPNIPNCRVIYIGTTYTSNDTNGTLTFDQNKLVRSIALRYGRCYADLMNPSISYPWLVQQGYMADTVHLNNAGGSWGANILWSDVGLFALLAGRTLSIAPGPGAPPPVVLSFPTMPGIHYRLDFYTNAGPTRWLPQWTVPGSGVVFSTNLGSSLWQGTARLTLRP